MVLWQRLATCRRGYGDLQSATVFPGILPFRYTCKSIAFCQSCAIFRKKGHCSNLIFGAVNTLAFLDSKKWSSPVQHVDVCVILPAFCGFMVSGELLKQLGAFRASCRNPKNRIATRSNSWIWRARFLVSPAIKIEIENSLEMALSKAKSGCAWQSHFWQCGTLRPARNTKLFTLRK